MLKLNSASRLALLAVNLIPMLGVLFFRWDLYSIMLLFAEMYRERDFFEATEWSKHFFIELSDFVNDFDWSNSGPLRGLGGEAGVNEALEIIKEHRRKSKLKLVQNG